MKQIKILAIVFVVWTLIGSISKVFFLLMYHSLIPTLGIGDGLAVLWYGLVLDMAIAGYFSLLPGLMLIISIWHCGGVLRWIWKTYFLSMAFVSSLAYVSNIALYAYWGFPLDSTPLLYIKTSPIAALASMNVWQMALMPIILLFVSVGIYKLMPRLSEDICLNNRRGENLRGGMWSILILFLCAILVIPIRGGLGTGTNHTGSVYFSRDMRLNHAAVNPIFCFLESVLHQEEISTQYHFMERNKVDAIFSSMIYTRLRSDAVRKDYNVVFICLESFSKYIMTEAGNVSGVTPNLDRYSHEGLYFTNFYANSTRTDRALVSVLSGLPAQPTMSVMDLPRISTSLPSIARSLGINGYNTHFYYGGDTSYSNMKSYLVGTGFQKITSQYDFAPELNVCKWGVADEAVFARLFVDIEKESANVEEPFLKVFMTSSSHEPFDVPHYRKIESPALNAFSYTDYHLGIFIEKLKTLSCWEKTIVVIMPDHLGAYPAEIDNYQLWRYDIPFMIIGGPIKQPRKIPVIGSQIDICATVLSMLGLPHDDFIYSKDLLDAEAPHYAFFTFPDAVGVIGQEGYAIYDNKSSRTLTNAGLFADTLVLRAKAFLQKLYEDLGKRQNMGGKKE